MVVARLQITVSHSSLPNAEVSFVRLGEINWTEERLCFCVPFLVCGQRIWSRPCMGQLGWQVVSQFTTRLGALALEGQPRAEGRSSGPHRKSPGFLPAWLLLQPPMRTELISSRLPSHPCRPVSLKYPEVKGDAGCLGSLPRLI